MLKGAAAPVQRPAEAGKGEGRPVPGLRTSGRA
jgi:hypothetical protein